MFSSYKNSALQHHLFFIKSGCRYLYSLWFNFRHFPWAIAKNLPIVFFKGAYAEISGQGKIVLTDSFIERNKYVMVGREVKDFGYQCEKTYSDLSPFSVIGGMPAKLLKSDFTRVWDKKREDEYMKREFEWYRLKQGE